jgi:hypothetical protein
LRISIANFVAVGLKAEPYDSRFELEKQRWESGRHSIYPDLESRIISYS